MENKNIEEAKKEIIKFHVQVLRNVIKVIKVNQKEVERIHKKNKSDFHLGSIAFGNVIIYQLNEEINRTDMEGKK